MSAIEKTKSLGREELPVDKLVANDQNPNEMSEAEFNMLADNIEKMGITDAILVRPLPDGRYRIVGGHHRWEVAKILGFETVPCTVIVDPDFDEDQEKFQVVRMNVIRGHLSPQKFMKMYESLSGKYAQEVMAESFGFAQEEEFKKLIKQVAKTLPVEVQKDFEKAAGELKTIDGLSLLLNSLFTKYGDTLPYGYMFFDFGGKQSIWLRMSSDTKKAMMTVGKMCVQEKRTVDAIVGGLIQLMADGKLSEQVLQLIAKSEAVEIPEAVSMPTEEGLLSGGAHAAKTAGGATAGFSL